MLLTISGETMFGGHQRTLSNRRLPSSQSKPTAVDRQKDFSINYGKRLPKPPKFNKREKKLKKESVRCLHVVISQASLCLQACACAPVNKTDHQCWTATHVDTVNTTRPHELRVISLQSYSTRNLRTRSDHPPEVASQLQCTRRVYDRRARDKRALRHEGEYP